MIEALVTIGILVLLACLGLLATLPIEAAAYWGSLTIAAGFLLGVPTGVVYHVLLWRELRRVGPVPSGWIWNPFGHHHRIGRRAERHVLPWAIAGGVGFVLIVIGMAVVTGGMVNSWLMSQS
jgi:hypothetical protein